MIDNRYLGEAVRPMDRSNNGYKSEPVEVHVWKCKSCGAAGWVLAYFSKRTHPPATSFDMSKALENHSNHVLFNGISCSRKDSDIHVMDGFE